MKAYNIVKNDSKLIENIPQLLDDGYVPASIATIVAGMNAGDIDIKSTCYSGDCFVAHPDKGAKLLRGNPTIWERFVPDAPLYEDALWVDDGFYESHNGFHMSWQLIEEYYNKIRSLDQNLGDRAWRFLIPDHESLKTYLETGHAEADHYQRHGMAMHFGTAPPVPTLRPLCVVTLHEPGIGIVASDLGSNFNEPLISVKREEYLAHHPEPIKKEPVIPLEHLRNVSRAYLGEKVFDQFIEEVLKGSKN